MRIKKLLFKGLVYSTRTLSLLVMGSLIGCGLKKTSRFESPPSEAIIGGIQVPGSDKKTQIIASSIVAIYDDESGDVCTGTLIAPNIVLTAAHCLGQTESMQVIFEQDINKKNPVRRSVDTVEVSPYWNTWRHEAKDLADIAIVRFNGTAPANYRPAAILKSADIITDGARIVIGGYGVNDGALSLGGGILRLAQTKIVDGDFSESEATIDQRNNTGACRGDSGGPAFIEINRQIYLWGIVARGVEDDRRACDTFAAITKISFHQAWLTRMINKLRSSINSIEVRP